MKIDTKWKIIIAIIIIIVIVIAAIAVFYIGPFGTDVENTEKSVFKLNIEGAHYIVKVQIPNGWDDILNDTKEINGTVQVSSETIDGIEYLVINGSGYSKVIFELNKKLETPFPSNIAKAYVEMSQYSVLRLKIHLGRSEQTSTSASATTLSGEEQFTQSGWADMPLSGGI